MTWLTHFAILTAIEISIVVGMDVLFQNKGSAYDCKTAIRHCIRALYGHDDSGK